jgi:polyisoprenoid-binding protein YceI
MAAPVLALVLAASPAVYGVDAARSSVVVHVGKAGLLSFAAGHVHDILATKLEGEVVADAENLAGSRVSLIFEAAGLRVDEKKEPSGDGPKVQEAMAGPKLLDVARFPTITFASTAVTGRAAGGSAYDLEVTGDLALHGATQRIKLPVHVELRDDGLEAKGKLTLKQTAFGLAPISVAGVVKVKDELTIEFTIVATRRQH